MSLIFENYKFRCSSLGHIMTCLPEPITPEQLKELAGLKKEKEEAEKAKKRFFKYQQEAIDKLEKLANGKDELPTGCITHLEDIFRSQFWGRKRLVYNKYLEKGNIVEEDSLDLISKLDGVPYWKNTQQFENDYIQGSPDNIHDGTVRDTKSNFDLDTFDKADMTKLYEYQVKGYMWLTGYSKGELCYCLVNTPYHRLKAEEKSLFYAMGQPEETDSKWIEAVCQLERNMIFDMAAFRKEFPNADLMHGRQFQIGSVTRTIEWKHDIPPKFRVKRFPVTLEDKDKEAIIRRVTMCREWLVNRELETLKLLEE